MADDLRGRFVWYDLVTSDEAGAVRFYGEVLGWGTRQWEQPGIPPYVMWTQGEDTLGGVMGMPPGLEAPPYWLAYVAVPDVDASVAWAQGQGATVVKEADDIPDVGRFAILQDPQGGTVALFSAPADAPTPPSTPAPPGRFSWHELACEDSAAALAFYGGLVGWEAREEMDMGEGWLYRLFGRPGEDWPLGGMFDRPPEMADSAWIFYVRVTDLDATVQRVQDAGGTLMNGPMEVPGGDRVAQCMDPQGGIFALHQTAG